MAQATVVASTDQERLAAAEAQIEDLQRQLAEFARTLKLVAQRYGYPVNIEVKGADE